MEQVSDAQHAASNVTRLIMENDRIRVLDVRFKPREKAAMHTHPDHIIYFLNNGKMKLTSPEGEVQEMDFKTGEAVWMDATSHAAENLGKTDVHMVVVELKK